MARPKRPTHRPTPGPHAAAFATTVMALVVEGRIGQADEALVTLGAHLAQQLDVSAEGTTKTLDLDKLAHQYRMAVVALIGEDDDADGDPTDKLDLFESLEAAAREGRGQT